MPSQIASLYAEIGIRDNLTQGLNNAKRQLDGFAGHVRRTGQQLRSMGQTMTLATAPLAAGLGLAINSAKNFEEAMTNAGAILGQTAEEMEAINNEILAIGGNSRAGPQAAAEAYYDIVSAVQDTTTHMDILNQSIATAEAGNTSLATTTEGLINVMNAYNLTAQEAEFASNVFTRTVQMGKGSMEEFVSSLSPAAGLASSMSIGFDELAGSVAFMTTKGHSASASVTAMTSAMTAFLTPNAAMQEALTALGFESGLMAVEQLGLAGAIEAVSDATGGLSGELASALGRKEALGAAIVLLDENYDEFFGTYVGGIEGATEATRELQNQSFAAQWDIFTSAIEELAIKLGQVLLPILQDVLAEITPIVDNVVFWIQENPELARTILMVVGGLVLLGPILMLAGTLFTAVGVAISAVTSAAGLLTLAFGVLSLPALALIGIIGGLIYWLEQNADGGFIGAVRNTINILTMLGLIVFHGLILPVFGWFRDRLTSVIEGAKLFWEELRPVVAWLTVAWAWIKERVNPAVDLLGGFMETVVGWFDGLAPLINGVVDAVRALVQPVIRLYNALKNLVSIGGTKFDHSNQSFTRDPSRVYTDPSGRQIRVLESGIDVLDQDRIINPPTPHGLPNSADLLAQGYDHPSLRNAPSVTGRALGGPVTAGAPYIVGENGPELFVPGQDGGIVPNMGGLTVIVNTMDNPAAIVRGVDEWYNSVRRRSG